MIKNVLFKNIYYTRQYINRLKRRFTKKTHVKDDKSINNLGVASNLLLEKRKKIPVDFNIVNLENEYDLSIIIPVYNCEKYISYCLDSIINQNLKMKYEIICVNDGSTDNSARILKKYSDENDQISIITQENKGLSGARNSGMNIAKGKYLLFIDSDDFLCTESLNYYYDKIVKEDADIIIGRINKYITKYNVLFPLKYKKNSNNLIDICNNTTGTAWGKIYKRELWNNLRFFEKYMYEDSIVFLNVFLKAKKIISDSKSFYAFRSSDNSLFKRSKKNYSTIDMLWQIQKMEELNFFSELDNSKLQLIMWHLSAIIHERISCLNDEKILKACFIICCDIFNKIILSNQIVRFEFAGKNKKEYDKLVDAFQAKDFEKWLDACENIRTNVCI